MTGFSGSYSPADVTFLLKPVVIAFMDGILLGDALYRKGTLV